MKGKTVLERIWVGCDYVLLVAVFVLLGVVWHSQNSSDAPSIPGRASLGEEGRARSLFRTRLPSGRVVDGIRVSSGRSRMNTIARSMVAAGWEQTSPTPAMDMREDGKTYEVLFSLPEGVDEESVRVSAAGNVLTLTMKAGGTGRLYTQRIRIPCGVDRADAVQSVVSNDVLHVRIQPPKG